MRPIRLTIEGFRSFRNGRPATVTFDDLRTVAIVGGHRKRRILDPGSPQVRPVRRDVEGARVIQEAMHNDARKLKVELEFETGERRYRVNRKARRTRKGLVTGAGAKLSETTDDGERIAADGVTRVNDEVAAGIIGMNADAFQRTTILPQGKFSRLLAEDVPATRAGILRQIWATTELEDAKAAADGTLRKLARLVTLCTHERANHPGDLEAHETGLRTDEDEAKRLAENARRGLGEYDRATTERATAEQEAGEHDARRARLLEIETSLNAMDTETAPRKAGELRAQVGRRGEARAAAGPRTDGGRNSRRDSVRRRVRNARAIHAASARSRGRTRPGENRTGGRARDHARGETRTRGARTETHESDDRVRGRRRGRGASASGARVEDRDADDKPKRTAAGSDAADH